MKKIFTFFLVLIISLTTVFTLIIFKIGDIKNKDITSKVLEKVKVNEIVTNTVSDNYLDIVYRRLKVYKVDNTKVDEIINSELFNKYASEISSEYISFLLSDDNINKNEIDSKITKFMNEANTEYNLDLSLDDIDDLRSIVSSNVYKTSLSIKENPNIKVVKYIINFCSSLYLRFIMVLLLVIELIILYFLTKKRKTYFNNIAISLLLTSLILSGSTYITYLLVKSKMSFMLSIINTIANYFYKVSLIFTVIAIILFIINFILKKKKTS